MTNPLLNDFKQKIKNGNPITRLIIFNAAVFLVISIFRILTFLSGEATLLHSIEAFLQKALALPISFPLLAHRPWTLITYMFTHVALMHIFWNMITLYWFGEILSQYTSNKKIIPLYILGGIAGALITILLITFIPALQIYIGAPLIGASAGVTAIIIAAATLVPEVKMNMLFIGPVKLLYVALFVVFIDVLSVASYDNVGGNLAHLGGAIMGFVFIVQYKKGRDMAAPFNRFFGWIGNLFGSTPKSKLKVAYTKKMSDEDYNYNKKVEQEVIDRILDKISKSGYDSLSKTEKDLLFKASGKK
ncbi:MAG: rhomboid family intramembrane serine protease [Bacteroidetes bacterium]|nr:rhomboid family intramembrane serine protease [Bacteroidota bacterium]